MFLEYEPKLEEFTELELKTNGVKERTAKGYAIKDVAAWWLFRECPESSREMGYSWEGYISSGLHHCFFHYSKVPFSM